MLLPKKKKEKEERFISLKIFLEEYIIPLEFLGINSNIETCT